MDTELKRKSRVKPYEQRVRKRFSTYIMMMFFAIGSITILFLTMTLTYLFSKDAGVHTVDLVMPPVFYVDTVILGLGSLGLYMASRAFRNDRATAYKSWIYVAFLSGLAFLIGQVIGWVVLHESGFGLTSHRSASFLYVISGIHALHIVGGIVFLAYIFLNASSRLKDNAISLVYFTDPVPKARLRLAGLYWHFLGVLWLYLLVFFSIVR